MKIKIVSPQQMGLMPSHIGKAYDAERIERGYIAKVWKRGAQPHIDDRWIADGHAVLVVEDAYTQYSPWGLPTP
jgi:hypothetical protein